MSDQLVLNLAAAVKKLALACNDLDKMVITKINEHRNSVSKSLIDDNQKKMIEQLQQEVDSLKRDSALFVKENEELISRINQIRARGSELVRDIKVDIKQIKSIIKDNNANN